MASSNKTLPELLAPAGSFDALEAAIEGGADAVYFGASGFNARMRAKNFSDDEFINAVKLCRAYGVRSYITLNTRIKNIELDDALKIAEKAYKYGADALILADTGLAALIRDRIGEIELHASTQLSCHSVRDAKALSELGFTRMVCPREMTLSQLEELVKNSPLEIEMFIHGAHCVSFSGQCLMSFFMGGRSGNRGECAQPCRLSYKGTNNPYPLSLKDMCLAGHIEEIIKTGVASLKIEGRQKSAAYVAGCVKIYRKLIDERRSATAEEIRELEKLFSRDGFTDGYFTGNHKNMLGVRGDERNDSNSVEGLKRKVETDARLIVKTGQASELTFTTEHRTVTATGDLVESAGGREPLSYDGALRNTSRLGNTPYKIRSFTAEIDSDAFFTLSQVNALRRNAVDMLEQIPVRELKQPDTVVTGVRILEKCNAKPLFTVEFLSANQITPLAEQFFDEIYLPVDGNASGYDFILPPVVFDNQKLLLPSGGRMLVHSPGQLKLAVEAGLEAHASFRLNVFNDYTAKLLLDAGACSYTVSPELSLGQVRAMGGRKNVIVYGRIPTMLTVRCAISDGGAYCRSKKDGVCYSELFDRTGVKILVVGMKDCTNVLYNSSVLYMADKQDELKKLGCARYHFIFTNENRTEVDKIIRGYKNGEPPDDFRNIRRLK